MKTKLLIIFLLTVFLSIGIITASENHLFHSFPTTIEKKINYSSSYAQSPDITLLTPNLANLKDEVLLDIPVTPQLPELPRGCEVTSLAMLLNHYGIDVDKMTLAKEIKREEIGVINHNGTKLYGNPHRGFVGDMYSWKNFGLGVYHEPISDLAEEYLPGKVHDFSNGDFREILYHLGKERPVWVIINTHYKHLPDSYFQTWDTKDGKVKVTYKEHSVLITGYDQDFIYFNDPLTNTKNRKAPIADFKDAWIQMGKQAITIK